MSAWVFSTNAISEGRSAIVRRGPKEGAHPLRKEADVLGDPGVLSGGGA